MTRIEGKNRFGEPVRIYLECCSKDLGYIKSKLDRTLYSPFLFISWKQKGFHTFKLVKEGMTLAEFPDFQTALDTYLDEGFAPEKSFRRAHSCFSLMCKSLRRRALFSQLVTLLDRSMAKKSV